MNDKDLDKAMKKAQAQIEKAINSKLGVHELTDYMINNQDVYVTVGIHVNAGVDYIPVYKTEGASGMDVRAKIDEPITLKPLERKIIPTGIHVDLPSNYEFQLRPRSGLAYKKGLTLMNCIGTIDDDYTGEIGALLVNLSNEPQTIEPSERIAQLVLAKVEKVEWEHFDSVESFSSKDRIGGWGSTGQK
jgi:dUTP pyrophosphatase